MKRIDSSAVGKNALSDAMVLNLARSGSDSSPFQVARLDNYELRHSVPRGPQRGPRPAHESGHNVEPKAGGSQFLPGVSAGGSRPSIVSIQRLWHKTIHRLLDPSPSLQSLVRRPRYFGSDVSESFAPIHGEMFFQAATAHSPNLNAIGTAGFVSRSASPFYGADFFNVIAAVLNVKDSDHSIVKRLKLARAQSIGFTGKRGRCTRRRHYAHQEREECCSNPYSAP